jgi:hypothetical protein
VLVVVLPPSYVTQTETDWIIDGKQNEWKDDTILCNELIQQLYYYSNRSDDDNNSTTTSTANTMKMNIIILTIKLMMMFLVTFNQLKYNIPININPVTVVTVTKPLFKSTLSTMTNDNLTLCREYDNNENTVFMLQFDTEQQVDVIILSKHRSQQHENNNMDEIKKLLLFNVPTT